MRLAKVLAGWVAVLLALSVTAALARPGSARPQAASHLAFAADFQAAGTAPARAASASGGPQAPASTATGTATATSSAGGGASRAPAGSQVQAPASGVPVGSSTQPPPAGPAKPTRQASAKTAPVVTLPTPSSGKLPAVPRLATTHTADAVVMLRSPLTTTQSSALRHLQGVTAIDVVDTGTVTLAGAQAVTFGVDPGTFREFTPTSSATADRLWQYLAGGALVSSYEMATDRGLKLGTEEPIQTGASPTSLRGWMGAFASLGLPGVDLIVDRGYSGALGLAPNTGLVVSAPNLAGPTLQAELDRAVPGSAVELLHANQVPDAVVGDGLIGQQRSEIIAAALSRVGTPYVWGGAAPGGFDCSGLVQWSFRQAGILMPRTADEQFLTGTHIPLAAASPGDLLFWTYDPNDPGFVDHTAIYLGHGMMVVAPHTGLDVEVVPVPTSDFAGAVQVVLQNQ